MCHFKQLHFESKCVVKISFQDTALGFDCSEKPPWDVVWNTAHYTVAVILIFFHAVYKLRQSIAFTFSVWNLKNQHPHQRTGKQHLVHFHVKVKVIRACAASPPFEIWRSYLSILKIILWENDQFTELLSVYNTFFLPSNKTLMHCLVCRQTQDHIMPSLHYSHFAAFILGEQHLAHC